jgi:biopolymer transport protein ExbB/TolQ
MYILIFCSLLSVTIFLERIIYYRKQSKTQRAEFMARIAGALKNSNIQKAMDICRETFTPFSAVVYSGLQLKGRQGSEISNAMQREITIETTKLDRYIGIIVLGIIRAFHDIAVAESGGMSIVIGGVAEALVCTAAGLFVAIPAVIVFNYFSRRVGHFMDDMELCASELIDLIRGK